MWRGFFSHLGDEAPEYPWTIDNCHDNMRSFSDTYRQWRIHHALPVPVSSSASPTSTGQSSGNGDNTASREMNLDSNEPGEEKSEFRRVNSSLKRENETLRRAIAENSKLSVSALEDPFVLRETARRLANEQVTCDFATVVKYISFMPLGTRLSRKQLSRSAMFLIRNFDGKLPAEAELLLQGYLMACEDSPSLLRGKPTEFSFILDS
ncbi:hypothetical protein ACKLNR_006312 [Fusarium oxysporum f. sp. zingiberi]